MIDYAYGGYTPVCDGCGAELPAEDCLGSALDAMNDAGWDSVKLGQDWLNYCPGCEAGANTARPGSED